MLRNRPAVLRLLPRPAVPRPRLRPVPLRPRPAVLRSLLLALPRLLRPVPLRLLQLPLPRLPLRPKLRLRRPKTLPRSRSSNFVSGTTPGFETATPDFHAGGVVDSRGIAAMAVHHCRPHQPRLALASRGFLLRAVKITGSRTALGTPFRKRLNGVSPSFTRAGSRFTADHRQGPRKKPAKSPFLPVFAQVDLPEFPADSLYDAPHPAGNHVANRPASPSGRGPVGCSLLNTSHIRTHFDSKGMMMAKQCAFLLAGLLVMSSTVGCCCSHLSGRSGCSPCATGGCSPSYYPPGGTGYYQGYGSTAMMGGNTTAFAGDPTLMTASPIMPGTTYSTTALAPVNALPTY